MRPHGGDAGVFKTTAASLYATLRRVSARFGGSPRSPNRRARPREEIPFRAELFSADQMEEHGKTLAALHRLTNAKSADRLLPRLKDNESVLIATCDLLTAAVKENRRIAPAGEWLLDNFYLIGEQIRIAQRHLPKSYSRELPRLAKGPSAHLPRVYDLALETISHADGRVDTESLSRFIAAYQTVTPLKLGELWGIPIMLRLALIENLRRVAARVSKVALDVKQAGEWADKMMSVAEQDPTNLILVVADMARSNPRMVSAFVSELARRLQGQIPVLALALTWIEHRLAESGGSIEQMIQSETQKQAADQVTISNSIGSLRGLSSIDWREFVETMSVVEQKLREDPADVYGRMTFATRDDYRHQIERIAKHTRLGEADVARKAVQLAHENVALHGDDRSRHVGFFLADRNGIEQLESAVDIALPITEQLRRVGHRAPLVFYLGAILLTSALFTALVLHLARTDGISTPWQVMLGVAVAVAGSQLAVALVNWIATLLANPETLPKMDFSLHIPSEFRTMVVVPTMLVSDADIDALLEALEVRFLANQDSNLHFALLTDLRDASEERMADDAALVERARAGIDALNNKYRPPDPDVEGDIFFLFHRPRRWNAHEKLWMGWERKRGKLEELNTLLRGEARDRFSVIAGDIDVLSNVRYVITLDTDTQLPRDTARQLVGAMAHPLNRPLYDKELGRVVAGYGILQPRVGIALAGAGRSLYAWLSCSEPGVDPYTRVVSDVYQDLFGEGSFIGKGIYDVDAFRQSLDGKLPENRILSHDLIEGCHARSGLLSDVLLYEETPASYLADASRRHRWMRGDYQIARWALPGRAGARKGAGERAGEGVRAASLSALSHWKILDNLRRGLVAPALAALLLAGWFLPALPWLTTLAVLAIVLIPPLFATLLDLFRKPGEARIVPHIMSTLSGAGAHFAHAALSLVMLAHEAFFHLDAIARTLWRMLVSHTRLLEWNTAREAERQTAAAVRNGPGSLYRAMWVSPALALVATAGLSVLRPSLLVLAAPFLVLWFLAPAIAWSISRRRHRRWMQLSTERRAFLHATARKTWRFFETFAGPEDNWLPPDNIQEHPALVVAHRTSPTNMGLSLLSNLAAYDFGYITCGQLLVRTENALATMSRLERYQHHFLNWYDTQTLQPLLPRYVSSVDSGNLAGHLLVLRAGLVELADEKIVGLRVFEGLSDTLAVMSTTAAAPLAAKISHLRRDLESAFDSRPSTIEAMTRWLGRLRTVASGLVASGSVANAAAPGSLANAGPAAAAAAHESPEALEAQSWVDAFVAQCDSAMREIAALVGSTRLSSSASTTSTAEASDASAAVARNASAAVANNANAVVASNEGVIAAQADGPRRELKSIPTLRELAAFEAATVARNRLATIDRLLVAIDSMVRMDYDFLYDRGRKLLSIGYNVTDRRRDASYYDLLASEARLASFVAIAQGQLPQDNWFALSRLLTQTGGEPVLLSWSGSMFEYLMPLLVMPTYEHTLLDQTYMAAVSRQIAYGHERDVPWGISESGYNAVDAALNYQYRAFGVPGVGLQRGLGDDLVVAPYATVLALMVAPEAAATNLQRLSSIGAEGRYGFYEAIDYTSSRLPRGQSSSLIRSFMAHHQGMSMLSFAYLLRGRPMQRRFAADPQLMATMLLLQERIPKVSAYFQQPTTLSDIRATVSAPEMPMRVVPTADTPVPEVQLLSNGRYHVMVSNAGGGYSRWNDLAVTRWREDATCDDYGTFCYIRDVASGEVWSSAHHPTRKRATSYEAIFSESRAEFRRRDKVPGVSGVSGADGGDYDTHTEIVVSPEDDIELRRMHIRNRSRNKRTIEVTSYAEVVLAPAAADASHPAFSNLFVQTEIIHQRHAILCTRRPRAPNEKPPFMLHLMVAHGAELVAHPGAVSYETDRSRFIGRGRSLASPEALTTNAALSGTEGSVLDPIVAIRQRITLEPDQTVVVDVVLGVAETRDAALALVAKYHDRHLADRVFDLASTHGSVLLRQINATEAGTQLFARLAGSVIYSSTALRSSSAIVSRNRRGQSGLWSYAISGDLPIVLMQIGDAENIDLVRQLVQAHAYWRMKGLIVDLVIWNEDRAGYRALLQEQIMGLIAASVEAQLMDKPGGVFVRRAEQIPDEDRVLLQSVARVIISDRRGSLAEQVARRSGVDPRAAQLAALRLHPSSRLPHPEATGVALRAASVAPDELLFFNGLGGFAKDGREYVIRLEPGQTTPAPWVNVLANDQFGTVVSESGMAYTWSENARLFRVTPWNNDPVSDAAGEAFYVRDEETGQYWSPAPLPVRGTGTYVTRHGFGYSIFEHAEDEIATELATYVDAESPVKYAVLKVTNESGRSRRLSATGYVEWVLGELRAGSLMHVITEVDPGSGAISARNAYNMEFPDRIAFFDVDELARTQAVSWTGDRAEFLGRNGSLKSPAAMRRTHLSNRTGAAMDPCAAIHVAFDLEPGQSRELVFRMGVGRNAGDGQRLMQRARGSAAARAALDKVRAYWRRTLGTVQVDTGDPAIDLLANGWLPYQTLACRLWARSGFYQSGGAFGFRDQLQDAMALVHCEPLLLRAHLLRCATRQFREGDVQHWWHPPAGRGVRTKVSDDYLWLPLATARYVESTGDAGVLQEMGGYLEGRPLNDHEESYYDMPSHSDRRGSLYEHCVAAITHGLRFGEHGLPLMGAGDWNDGMNLVGIEGKGESVWLAFFLHEVLARFAGVARLMGDLAMVERCQVESQKLRANIEKHAWDGEWYRRAWFDDGTPLGSHENDECRIDAIAQSWSVLSGVADRERARTAMQSLNENLVRRDAKLIQLLDPPFDKSALNPGYIRGYVPGVRENGGQYTHAAIWTTMAFAALGDGERAWELMAMINPLHHGSSAADVEQYRVEPYVVAADVYAVPPHTGRGGWTWYTGSAGWMYRLIVESLLGVRLEVDRLRFAPCLPASMQTFKVDYRYRETMYRITVTQLRGGEGQAGITVDGVEQAGDALHLIDDRVAHLVEVKVRSPE